MRVATASRLKDGCEPPHAGDAKGVTRRNGLSAEGWLRDVAEADVLVALPVATASRLKDGCERLAACGISLYERRNGLSAEGWLRVAFQKQARADQVATASRLKDGCEMDEYHSPKAEEESQRPLG